MKKKTGYFKDYNQESDLVRFVASSGSIDREGEALNPDGWVLDNFKKNPVLLWSHDAYQLPIGKVSNVYTEGNNLIADTEFAVKENDFAKKVFDLIKGGFLNAVSVGFMPLEYDNAGKVIKQELLELSVVNVPANQDALRSNMYQAFVKSLDTMEKKQIEIKTEEKKETKSPMCRMTDESKEQCVARKIPEIMNDDASVKRDQAIAMAESMCEKSCDEKDEKKNIEVEQKEGRIISEKNRNSVRIAIEAMKQASDQLTELLNATEPPAKKGGVDTIEQKSITREIKKKRIYNLARLSDKIGEQIIREIKEGGELQ